MLLLVIRYLYQLVIIIFELILVLHIFPNVFYPIIIDNEFEMFLFGFLAKYNIILFDYL